MGKAQSKALETTILFEQESLKGVTYRIPALLYLPEGRVYVAFAEKRTSPSDNHAESLVMRRGTWSPCEELSTAQLPDHRSMNPCPVYDRKNKTLFLFFICVRGNVTEQDQKKKGVNAARLCFVTSPDFGVTWGAAKDLTESVVSETWATFAVGPGHGVQLSSGRLVVPAYAYYKNVCECFCFRMPFSVLCSVESRALSIYSDDDGSTWQAGQLLNVASGECQMVEVVGGGRSRLYCNARRRSSGCRLEALSEDEGEHFGETNEANKLSEPSKTRGCQGSVVGFPDPRVVCEDAQSTWLAFSHPTDKTKRRDLGVYLNRTPLRPCCWPQCWWSPRWDPPVVIYRGPSGYSDLAYEVDGRFACLLECGKRSELEKIDFIPNGVTYRIPALLYLPEGRVYVAFAEKRTSRSDSDAESLVMRRGTWSPCEELSTAHLPDHRSMNPCPVYDRTTRTLFLFFICVRGHVTERHQIVTGRNVARLCLVASHDLGVTWGAAEDLTERVVGRKRLSRWATFAVGPGHGMQLASGRLVVPAYAYYERVPKCLGLFPVPFSVQPRALSVYSDDAGRTWRAGELLHSESCECQMAEVEATDAVTVAEEEGGGGSRLYCNARRSRQCRLEAMSGDGGEHFGEPNKAEKLVEPRHGCQGSVVGFPAPRAPGASSQSTWLAFSHPTDRRGRRDLGVYLNRAPLRSRPGWDPPVVIYRGPSGYSDLAYELEDGRFACLLECGERSELEKIAFMSFTLSDIIKCAQP
ncbi:hypothetical protein CRUP_022278 [Coryphaenoides rupestris]|nr:hypothetical protein CRUP_022278 [Coryphaenoides rupestris]